MAARRPKAPIEEWTGQVVLPEVSVERPRDVKESTVLASIRAVLERIPGVIVLRNNVGAAKLRGFWVRFGLGKGSSDLVCIIAPTGRACFIETKRPKGGRLSKEQEQFIANMRAMGAVAGVAHSVDDALALVREAKGAA